MVWLRAFWVLPLRGPCWKQNTQERAVSGVRGAQGCGVLTWECAGSSADGNISFFCPPRWVRAAFFCACVCRGPGWPGGAEGGAQWTALPRRWPPPVTASLRSTWVEAPLMTGWGSLGLPDGRTRFPALPRGLLPSTLVPQSALMTGHGGLSGALPRGRRREGGSIH